MSVCLILHTLCSPVLVSVHLKEQTPLPVFKHWFWQAFSCQVPGLMILTPGLQLSGVGAGSCGCFWVCCSVHVSGPVTRALGRYRSCLLVPERTGLPSQPWLVGLELGQGSTAGCAVGFRDGGLVTRYVSGCSSCWVSG